MPRKSAASLSIMSPALGSRSPPPANLSGRQKALWIQITAAKPADWFGQDTLPMLTALVAHIETFEVIEREFVGLEKLDQIEKLTWLEKLCRLRDRESKAITSLSTRLRLTQQSRYTPQAAATASRRASGPRPWEEPNPFDNNGIRPTHN